METQDNHDAPRRMPSADFIDIRSQEDFYRLSLRRSKESGLTLENHLHDLRHAIKPNGRLKKTSLEIEDELTGRVTIGHATGDVVLNLFLRLTKDRTGKSRYGYNSTAWTLVDGLNAPLFSIIIVPVCWEAEHGYHLQHNSFRDFISDVHQHYHGPRPLIWTKPYSISEYRSNHGLPDVGPKAIQKPSVPRRLEI